MSNYLCGPWAQGTRPGAQGPRSQRKGPRKPREGPGEPREAQNPGRVYDARCEKPSVRCIMARIQHVHPGPAPRVLPN